MKSLLMLATAGLVLGAGAPKKDPRADEDPAKEARKLEGEWQAFEAEVNGKKRAGPDVRNLRLVFRGDTITVKSADGSGGERKQTFKLDPGKSPRRIDITSLDGAEKGHTAAGIYALERGRLKLCMPYFTKDPGKRPGGFKTAPGDGLMLLVWERVKAK